MLKNYFTVSWRNLLRHKAFSVINIGGLAMGMTVAILIGLWIFDELSFNRNHDNYDRIARVMQRQTLNGVTGVSMYMPIPVGNELAESYAADFEHVAVTTFQQEHIITYGDKSVNQLGHYMQPEAPEMLSLRMIHGTRSGLRDMNSILLSATLARTLFGDDDPINKVVRIDDRNDAKVTGVYQQLPNNSEFHETTFIAPWDLYVSSNGWLERFLPSWSTGMVQILVQLRDGNDLTKVDRKISNVIKENAGNDELAQNFEVFLHPMSKWHLYESFDNGYNTGGRIQFVWLFGIIGAFVLLLACINFMNLSTARSEKRAKEVGIRKAVGSVRKQIVGQFFTESILIVALAFVLATMFVVAVLPWFNQIADKQMDIPWSNSAYWMAAISFILFTGAIAGSYPAIYLSSFHAVKVLKGSFRAGRRASLPRQVLVVFQFTVSVMLIVGTMVVYEQIQYAMQREVGYDREQLIYLKMKTGGMHDHFSVVRGELIKSGAIVDMAESNSVASQDYQQNFGGYEWRGKDPDMFDRFGVTWVTPEYGATVGWKLTRGRDFSRDVEGDRQGMIINESAVRYMGFEDPVGEVVKLEGHPFTIVGVVQDLVVGSPYEPTRPAIYAPMSWPGQALSIRLNPVMRTADALAAVQSMLKKYDPAMPFDYQFVDDEYARKFENETRMGTLASVFAALAIAISCLGLFGLAAFVAEQRKKEIGIRKVVGANVFNVWSMLSKDFIMLVAIACLIALPLSWYIMKSWLNTYEYRTGISVWVMVFTASGAMVITLVTVSYQALSAALLNPVKSLRAE